MGKYHIPNVFVVTMQVGKQLRQCKWLLCRQVNRQGIQWLLDNQIPMGGQYKANYSSQLLIHECKCNEKVYFLFTYHSIFDLCFGGCFVYQGYVTKHLNARKKCISYSHTFQFWLVLWWVLCLLGLCDLTPTDASSPIGRWKKKIVRYYKSNAKVTLTMHCIWGIIIIYRIKIQCQCLTPFPTQPLTWATKELKILKRERERTRYAWREMEKIDIMLTSFVF